MKFNFSPDEFVDFIVMFLLDVMSNKDMQVLKTSNKLKALTTKLISLGFKPVLLLLFFTIDATTRTKYRQFRDVFDRKSSNQHSIFISQDAEYLKKIKDKKDINKIKKAINTTLKLITSGRTISQRDLELIQEKVLKVLEKEGEI